MEIRISFPHGDGPDSIAFEAHSRPKAMKLANFFPNTTARIEIVVRNKRVEFETVLPEWLGALTEGLKALLEQRELKFEKWLLVDAQAFELHRCGHDEIKLIVKSGACSEIVVSAAEAVDIQQQALAQLVQHAKSACGAEVELLDIEEYRLS